MAHLCYTRQPAEQQFVGRIAPSGYKTRNYVAVVWSEHFVGRMAPSGYKTRNYGRGGVRFGQIHERPPAEMPKRWAADS